MVERGRRAARRRTSPWFAAGVVVCALHFAHCPSVTSGPGTGCVSGQTDTVGRFFPTLPSKANVLLVRVDEDESGISPTATYVREYVAPAVGPTTLLTQLSIDQCTCVRDLDGARCDTDTGLAAPAATTCDAPAPHPCDNEPQPCPSILLRGLGARPPPCTADAGCLATCVPDVTDTECDADGGEICHTTTIGGLCSYPLELRYAPAAGRMLPVRPIQPASLPDNAFLTFLLQPTATPSNTATAPKCPTVERRVSLAFVPRTVVLAPTAGARIRRSEGLAVDWVRGEAQFALIQLRGKRGAIARTLACRPPDRARGDERDAFRMNASLLAELDPGSVTLEAVRMNAVQSDASPLNSVVIYTTSTRSIQLTLE